jgi:GNAT superfamily N-acetyltransferase
MLHRQFGEDRHQGGAALVRIRLAEPSDLPAVSDLTRRAYEHYIPIIGGTPMPMIEDNAPRIADGQVWLMEDGATSVGLLILEEREDALMIYSVAVAPERQHSGLGQRLLSFAEHMARDRGFSTIALYTNAKMERNIGIYRRFGYVETRRRPHPTRAGFVIVDMEKSLGTAGNRRSA